jgi:ABC-type sulfate/molybdate transport systems ATPase subunit
LLVLDEPYAGLDDEARLALASVLRDLRLNHGIATVVVSHDLDNAEMLGERLVRLEAGSVVGEELIAW